MANEGKSNAPDSVAKRLIQIGEEAELFHNERKEAFAAIQEGPVRMVLPLRDAEFKHWLCKRLHDRHREVANQDQLTNALNTLNGKACYGGMCYSLCERFAVRGSEVWLDMCDEAWRGIRVTGDGWEIVETPPILFHRYNHQKSLPEPDRDGDLFELLRFLNLKRREDDGLLIAAWLVTTVLSNIARPLLFFHGPQGSAKTTAARMLRSIVDPSESETLFLRTGDTEIAQVLQRNPVPLFDNLSYLKQWQADLLCLAVTGGGFTKRRLYTDEEEIVFHLKRPVIGTGINIPTQAPDLLDRLLSIELERFSPEARREEDDLWKEFEPAKARILGGLLNTLVKALQIHSTLEITRKPRLADFGCWGEAISQGMGNPPDRFMSAYFQNIDKQLDEVLENPVATALVKLCENGESWQGTASELLSKLEEQFVDGKKPETFPRQPNKLSRELKKLQSHLAEAGVDISWARGRSRGRMILIRGSQEAFSSSSSSQPSQTQRFQQVKEDGKEDDKGNGSSRLSTWNHKEKDDRDGKDGNFLTSEEEEAYEERVSIMLESGVPKQKAEWAA